MRSKTPAPGIAGTRELIAPTGPRAPAFLLVSVIALCAGSSVAQNAQYIGAEACGTCHPAQLKQQSGSAHSRSLYPAPEHPLAPSFTPSQGKQFLRRPNFHFQLSSDGSAMRVRASDDKDVMDIPMEWAFGAGEQAVTFVTRVNEEWYIEHYLSYYSAIKSFAPTPGQDSISANTLPLAMGILYKSTDPETGILKCFECHSTGPVSVGSGQLQPAELGVRCEACHGPGDLHRAAARSGQIGKARELIQNPRRMSAPDLNRFCGNCHRQPAPAGVSTDFNVAWNVRHQPVYLSQSACFLKSGSLSCLTCHDPHGKLQKDDAFYNARCRTCHSTESTPPKPVCIAKQPANCVACHMPGVSPQAYLRFTNHWIGVYSPGAKLKPLR